MGGSEAISPAQRRRVLAVVRAFPGLTAAELLAATDSATVRSWLPQVLRNLRECAIVRVEEGRYWPT
ncbi:hypothetical protein [Streptomyces sp. NPDC058371]|uniref:hypothetical protein n=1 Tax=Streptomyces sp. NPDC058371 TaxID=3346463 RepID=UPI00365F7866